MKAAVDKGALIYQIQRQEIQCSSIMTLQSCYPKTLHHHKNSRKRYIIEDCTCKVSRNECTGSISEITRQKGRSYHHECIYLLKTLPPKESKTKNSYKIIYFITAQFSWRNQFTQSQNILVKQNVTNFEIGLTNLPAK